MYKGVTNQTRPWDSASSRKGVPAQWQLSALSVIYCGCGLGRLLGIPDAFTPRGAPASAREVYTASPSPRISSVYIPVNTSRRLCVRRGAGEESARSRRARRARLRARGLGRRDASVRSRATASRRNRSFFFSYECDRLGGGEGSSRKLYQPRMT